MKREAGEFSSSSSSLHGAFFDFTSKAFVEETKSQINVALSQGFEKLLERLTPARLDAPASVVDRVATQINQREKWRAVVDKYVSILDDLAAKHVFNAEGAQVIQTLPPPEDPEEEDENLAVTRLVERLASAKERLASNETRVAFAEKTLRQAKAARDAIKSVNSADPDVLAGLSRVLDRAVPVCNRLERATKRLKTSERDGGSASLTTSTEDYLENAFARVKNGMGSAKELNLLTSKLI